MCRNLRCGLSGSFWLMVAAILLAGSRPAGAVDLSPRILLHARTASTAHHCQPGLASCAAAEVRGQLNLLSGAGNYFVYLMAARFDPAIGAREIHVGLSYDLTTLSGVDIFGWNSCADTETPTAEWFQAGGANRLSWNNDHCRQDSLAVGGYFYLTSYTPGYIAAVAPEGADVSLTYCNGAVETIPTQRLGYIGFGEFEGCNPCDRPCNYVPVATVTWSRVKTLFR